MNNDLPERMGEKAVEETFKIARDFLDKIGSPASTQLGGILGDTVKYWRFKNAVNLTLRAKRFLESKGIEPRKVPPATLIPLLEAGSLHEDDDLQTRWSAMLAHAVNPDSDVSVTPAYPQILRQLSTLEVAVLDWLFESDQVADKELESLSPPVVVEAKKETVIKEFQLTERQFEVIASNLHRIGVVEAGHYYVQTRSGGSSTSTRFYSSLRLTPVGDSFVRSCKFG